MLSLAIIEDNLPYASALAQYISEAKQFFVKFICSTADEAMIVLRRDKVDIAIVDVELNGSCGVWLIRQLIAEGVESKFLVLTAHNDDETVFSALNAGAQGYLLKGTNAGDLVDALHELSNGGAPMSPSVSSKLLSSFRKLHHREARVGNLSMRENEIMQHLSKGLLYKEIGAHLGIERETVKKHLSKIYAKLNVQNKIEAMNKFFGN